MINEKDVRRILVNTGHKMVDASILVKRCDLLGSIDIVIESHVLISSIPDDLRNPQINSIIRSIGFVRSLLQATIASQNAADHASRISGMLDILAMILE